jgi:hypothetical protein
MVSNQKIKFFVKRVEQINKNKIEEIRNKYPEIKTDYVSLIKNGKGVIKSEEEIRNIIGDVSKYSCPAVIEVTKLFTFKNERTIAEKEENKRIEKINKEIDNIKKHVKNAMDLIYFGKDEDLQNALNDLENL